MNTIYIHEKGKKPFECLFGFSWRNPAFCECQRDLMKLWIGCANFCSDTTIIFSCKNSIDCLFWITFVIHLSFGIENAWITYIFDFKWFDLFISSISFVLPFERITRKLCAATAQFTDNTLLYAISYYDMNFIQSSHSNMEWDAFRIFHFLIGFLMHYMHVKNEASFAFARYGYTISYSFRNVRLSCVVHVNSEGIFIHNNGQHQ